MSQVIAFPTWRTPPAPVASPAALYLSMTFKPPQPPAANPRNRYDAALKGVMWKRANQLCTELSLALCRLPDEESKRNSRIEWVIDQICAIHDEVARTTPEHHPPAAS